VATAALVVNAKAVENKTMKLTKETLKRIIKEELEAVVSEEKYTSGAPDPRTDGVLYGLFVDLYKLGTQIGSDFIEKGYEAVPQFLKAEIFSDNGMGGETIGKYSSYDRGQIFQVVRAAQKRAADLTADRRKERGY
tara:strand:- start:827 stop:1234 length:408 start_codon:yes stop_codon:yes gene_type:complete